MRELRWSFTVNELREADYSNCFFLQGLLSYVMEDSICSVTIEIKDQNAVLIEEIGSMKTFLK